MVFTLRLAVSPEALEKNSLTTDSWVTEKRVMTRVNTIKKMPANKGNLF